MNELGGSLVGNVVMSAIALTGALVTVLRCARLERLLLPMDALPGGTPTGGTFFRRIPNVSSAPVPFFGAAWLIAGFSPFFALERRLHWPHTCQPDPLNFLR